MEKYNNLYIKYISSLSFGIALPITLILNLSAIIFKSFDTEAFIFSFFPLMVAVLITANAFLRIAYLKNLLKEQEKTGFIFDDFGAYPIYKKSIIFVSENWVIISGRLAFHKKFIKRIVIRKEMNNNTSGCPYALLFECINGEIYRYKLTSYSDGKVIKEWFNKIK